MRTPDSARQPNRRRCVHGERKHPPPTGPTLMRTPESESTGATIVNVASGTRRRMGPESNHQINLGAVPAGNQPRWGSGGAAPPAPATEAAIDPRALLRLQ